MKTLLVTTLGAFVITLVFVAGSYRSQFHSVGRGAGYCLDGFALVTIFNSFQ